ncbi:hypothetical protein FA15DRAFT_659110 [Coprinopsis marcescibilis]|uniref:Uncharacterized protein n=1 Tax=Coprinopsis marcescibilis TaxID=230819 RepID=A0A5C3KK01_COPMA|nr:hypothetical protein FA15DRAFT_659110 [Coprinopsis marcescibilis]
MPPLAHLANPTMVLLPRNWIPKTQPQFINNNTIKNVIAADNSDILPRTVQPLRTAQAVEPYNQIINMTVGTANKSKDNKKKNSEDQIEMNMTTTSMPISMTMTVTDATSTINTKFRRILEISGGNVTSMGIFEEDLDWLITMEHELMSEGLTGYSFS